MSNITYTQSGPVNASADLLWSAAIQDETGTFFTNFDANVDKLTKNTKNAFDNVDAGSKKSGESIGVLAGIIGGVTAKLIGMGMQAVQQFKGIVQSAIQVAARADTLAVSLKQVGNNAGYSDAQMQAFEDSMKNNGITTIKTREALLKMSQAQLDLTKSADLARVAQDAAVIAGTDSSEAFGRIIHGITTLQPEILRGLGIIVDFQTEYKKYANEIGTNTKQLDANQKQQIAMNAVLAAGTGIYGTYESALETAGKQAGSLARHQEELMLALGNAAQPAYLEWIQFMTRSLKEAREWFEENADSVEAMGKSIGFLIGKVLELTSAFVTFGASAPGMIRKVVPIFIIMDKTIKDMDDRWANLGATAGQFATLAATGLTVVSTLVIETAKAFWTLTESVVGVAKALADPLRAADHFAESMIKFNESVDTMGNAADKAREAGKATLLEWSEGLGLIESPAEEAEDAINGLADSMDTLADDTESAVSEISKLNAKLAKELADLAKKEMRERIDREIQLSRKLEDMARGHAERIQDIMENGARDRVKLAKDLDKELSDAVIDNAEEREQLTEEYNLAMIDREVEYQRTLAAIRQDFADNADELARRNDAVGLARLIRSTNRRLRDAKQAKEQEVVDSRASYDKDMEQLREAQAARLEEIRTDAAQRMQELDANIAARLAAEDASYAKSMESLNRSLQREAEDRARHRAWAEEDRREKYAAEVQALGQHLATLESLDALGLQYLLEQHGQFITEDLGLWDSYYASRRNAAASAASSWGSYADVRDDSSQSEQSGFGAITETAGDDDLGGWGFAQGGVGVATSRQRVTIAEEEPEMIAAMPLSAAMNHNIHVDDMNMNIQGVSEGMEQDLMPAMQAMFMQLAGALKANVANRRF